MAACTGYAGHGARWQAGCGPLSILINSLTRGPLMKWKVLIPLRGVASTRDRESPLWEALRSQTRPCTELPGRGGREQGSQQGAFTQALREAGEGGAGGRVTRLLGGAGGHE